MINFYCNCINGHENRHTQQNQTNLICGASSLDEPTRVHYKNKNFTLDNERDNISALNPWFGDLTGLYWIWKNTNHEIVGTNQYRRFWNDEHLNVLTPAENIIYVSSPFIFNSSVMEQYLGCHGPAGITILKEAIRHNRINVKLEFIDSLSYTNTLSACNMFFAHNALFNKVCDVLFSIMFELYEGSKYSLPAFFPDYQSDQRLARIFAFLSERVLTMIYMNKNYYFGSDTEVYCVPYNTL